MTPTPRALFHSIPVLFCLTLAACGGTTSFPENTVGNDGAPPPPSPQSDATAPAVDAGEASPPPTAADATPPQDDAGSGNLPTLAFCQVADPKNLAAAYTTQTGSDWVFYQCAQACANWTSCTFGVVDAQGQPLMSARGQPMQALAFVVDGMGGHFAFTPDGTDVVLTHAGSGGVSVVNPFDLQIQKLSTLKTVTLGWEHGSLAVAGSFSQEGAGWFTRKDANGTSVRAQTARPAAAIQWVQANFAVGHKFGTVGSSMGTVATLGAHVWHGLDAILDYQMFIGGPGIWDVNVGCGRAHIAQGYCDTDVSPCAGNPSSSYGNDDPVCPGSDPTNNCRVPTIMAPIASGSAYDAIINYVGATTTCAPTATESRDPVLDESSMAMTVTAWTFHGAVDFVADEGGAQPPDADQGMGEGHAMYMYAQIQSPKGWIDNQGTHHGDAFDKVPALMAATAQHVVTGMGH
jgi:hypothetical protein